MSINLPTEAQAHATVVGWHKQGFFGRLAEYGISPTTEKEARALLDLGIELADAVMAEPGTKAAAADQGYDYGDGPFAMAKAAHDNLHNEQQVVAPGFAKSASSGFATEAGGLPDLHPELVDAAYGAAYDLAQSPDNFGAAIVKRASNLRFIAEMQKQAAAGESAPVAAA